MSARRAPQTPPELPGFTYLDVLGSGGFADVFLYEQHLPRRRVAVKVLLTDRISSSSVAEFTAEANVMAMLSTHPAIVTIYQAGVAGDSRPYLVMEYCPKPNLQVRYRREPFAVAESLRVGVQVAGAVETAHRAGVLHRDIKPANILVTEYNRPALTDFGIASTTSAAAESAGLSIPWSPPESFADVPRSDRRSDVYALGATVYTLLAGRSPFEVSGQRNSAADLIQRIETMPPPVLDRADLPASLQHALQRAMAKSPDDRYPSALEFARALQKVQIELSHSVTPIDILDDGPPDEAEEADEADGLTRVRGVVSIDPATAPAAGLTRPATPTFPGPVPADRPIVEDTAPAAAQTVLRAPSLTPPASPVTPPSYAPVDIGETVRRPAAATDASAPVGERVAIDPERRSRKGVWVGLSAAAVVLAVVVVGALALPGLIDGMPAPTPSGTTKVDPVDVVPVIVAKPAELTGKIAGGKATFTWTNPDPHEGDAFGWGIAAVGAETRYTPIDEPTVTVPAAASGQTCISVIVRRPDGKASEPTTGCAP